MNAFDVSHIRHIATAKKLELPSYLVPPVVAARPAVPTMPPHRTLAQVEAELLSQVEASFRPGAMALAVEQAARER